MPGKIALYKTGYRAELRAKKILEGWGLTVMRSAKSGGPFDLIGFNDEKIVFVQVKVCPTGRVPSFGSLRREIAKIEVPLLGQKELWIWERRKGWHHLVIK